MKDSSRHVVLGTQQFKPSEFAAQINLSLDNCWGIVRCIIDQVMTQKDGKDIFFKPKDLDKLLKWVHCEKRALFRWHIL